MGRDFAQLLFRSAMTDVSEWLFVGDTGEDCTFIVKVYSDTQLFWIDMIVDFTQKMVLKWPVISDTRANTSHSLFRTLRRKDSLS